jgi:methylated-DNA-protein-cysteine methyltransferase-like protein
MFPPSKNFMINNRQENRNTFDLIYRVVNEIPCGKVATYGQIAAIVSPGLPARIVGYALHGLPENTPIPWHRVINSKGQISYAATRYDHDSLQQKLLEREGIKFANDGIINLKKYLWDPNFLNK